MGLNPSQQIYTTHQHSHIHTHTHGRERREERREEEEEEKSRRKPRKLRFNHLKPHQVERGEYLTL